MTDAEEMQAPHRAPRGRAYLGFVESLLTVRGALVCLGVAFAALGVYALLWPRESVALACARQQAAALDAGAVPAPGFAPLVWDAEHVLAKFVVAPVPLAPALDAPCLLHFASHSAQASGGDKGEQGTDETPQLRTWRHAAGLLCRLAAWDERAATRFVALYAPEYAAALARAPTPAARAALHGLVQLHRQGGVYVGSAHAVPATALDAWGRGQPRAALALEHALVCRALSRKGFNKEEEGENEEDEEGAEAVVVAAQTHPLVYEALRQLAKRTEAGEPAKHPIAVLGEVVAAQLARDRKNLRALQDLCAHPEKTAQIDGILLLPHGNLNPFWVMK